MSAPIPELPRPVPERIVLGGKHVRLEPLDAAAHAEELRAASSRPGREDRFRHLFEPPPHEHDFGAWVARAAASRDPLYWAVIDKTTGRCEGRHALMRITPEHGVIEIGSILWNPPLAGTRAATEALFLMAEYVFDTLRYRRFEWKCNALNAHSRRAADRFGFRFEGVFNQHMVVKGENRDTAWFAMLDHEWVRLREAYLAWLDPANFDEAGRQVKRLRDMVY